MDERERENPPTHERPEESAPEPRPQGSAEGAGSPPAPGSPPAEPEPLPPELQDLHDRVVQTLQTVYDPEIPVNIYELGMIYRVGVRPDRRVDVRMTLTSPMCPVAGSLPGEVEQKVAAVEGVAAASVELVWDPPWNPSMMSEAARLQLNL